MLLVFKPRSSWRAPPPISVSDSRMRSKIRTWLWKIVIVVVVVVVVVMIILIDSNNHSINTTATTTTTDNNNNNNNDNNNNTTMMMLTTTNNIMMNDNTLIVIYITSACHMRNAEACWSRRRRRGWLQPAAPSYVDRSVTIIHQYYY